VARYALIDGYLDTMRTQIRWRRDLDELVSEMEGHLYSTVENLLATGVEPKTAQRTTLDRFGEPKVLAAVYASTNSGGIAVPTKNTIRAGLFALVAGGLWFASAAFYVATSEFDVGDDGMRTYAVYAAMVLAASVLGLLAMVGVSKRLGGLGRSGMAGLVITGVGVAAAGIIAWALPLWMGLMGLGMLMFGLAVLRTTAAPKWGTLLVSSGFVIGVITFIIANAAKVGDRDVWGDYPTAWTISAVVGMAIVGLGFVGWGLWLRNEEPIDIDSDSAAITA
jgi:hypothetical protein